MLKTLPPFSSIFTDLKTRMEEYFLSLRVWAIAAGLEAGWLPPVYLELGGSSSVEFTLYSVFRYNLNQNVTSPRPSLFPICSSWGLPTSADGNTVIAVPQTKILSFSRLFSLSHLLPRQIS